MRKYEIVNALIAKNEYRRYLEICTPTTGLSFSRIDQTSLRCRHRLMYRCPANFEDGSEVTFRAENEDTAHLLDTAQPYDIIFVDPFHTFACSLRDLQLACHMLQPCGVMVVHDCCPKSREVCTPTFRPKSWFGLTYCAYIEFVLSHHDLAYYTVDTDCGCGVIKKVAATQATDAKTQANGGASELGRRWYLEKNQRHDMFDFFRQHRHELLNLISVKDFLALENVVLPRLSMWRETVSTLLHT